MWTQQKMRLLYFNELSRNFKKKGGRSFSTLKKGVENATF